jgi:hypothetical protein
MKAKEIVIATALILILGGLLSSCQGEEPNRQGKVSKQTAIEAFVLKAVAAKKEVKLALRADRTGDKLKVTVTLENPNLKPVTSVQSWLSFDPSKLQGSSIEARSSAFGLMAPYKNTFDNVNGLVMLGRANPQPVLEKSSLVAELSFDIVKDGTTTIDAYDYQDDLSGHTSANVLEGGKPFNVLEKPDSPLLIIE